MHPAHVRAQYHAQQMQEGIAAGERDARAGRVSEYAVKLAEFGNWFGRGYVHGLQRGANDGAAAQAPDV